jgi:hypothetical protein
MIYSLYNVIRNWFSFPIVISLSYVKFEFSLAVELILVSRPPILTNLHSMLAGSANNGWFIMIYRGTYWNSTDEQSSSFPNSAFAQPTYDYHTYDVGQDMAGGDRFSCGMSALVSHIATLTFTWCCDAILSSFSVSLICR